MLTSAIRTCKHTAVVTLLGTSLMACSTTETQSFQVSQNSSVESAQIAADADFGQYDRLHAVDMGIYFPQGSYTSPADMQQIRDIFRSAFLGKLEDYVIVTEPGPGAMTVQATLIDFRNATYQDMMSVRSELREMAAPGKILFLMEMRDSVTERTLARAADSAKTPTIADEKGETTDWTSVEDAAEHWASLFRQFLDENLISK
jgi:uncharacterized protein DUF3313